MGMQLECFLIRRGITMHRPHAIVMRTVFTNGVTAIAKTPCAVWSRSIELEFLLGWGGRAIAKEEVEVAALIGLQDGVFEKFGIAAARGLAVRWGLF